VAIDRDETLRKAEKLLRQGRLDAAIEEYARVAQDTPDDLATINKLGELYQRAGQVHTAITYYRRVADQWLRDGLDAKAATHYKKILKLRPDDESAMLQLVDALTHQGQLDEAKKHLRSALERREAAGDKAGAEDLVLRLGELDPNDFDARLMGLRIKLGRAHTPELAAELRHTITELDQRGRPDEADALLRELIRLDPADIQARVRVARTAMNRGDIETVREVLPPKPAESKHYDIVWMAAELDVIAGDLDGGRALLMRSLTIDRVRGTTDVLALAERLRKKNPGATWACIEALVEDRAAAKDFAKAADHLKRFLKQTPAHVPALLRLVEVCVDGDLEPDLTLAQALLADAYLQVGEAAQARVIAEDLLSREPRSAAHRERLKRALIALGEEDPEAAIAEHLNFLDDIEDKPEPPPVAAMTPEPEPPPPPALEPPAAPPVAVAPPASKGKPAPPAPAGSPAAPPVAAAPPASKVKPAQPAPANSPAAPPQAPSTAPPVAAAPPASKSKPAAPAPTSTPAAPPLQPSAAPPAAAAPPASKGKPATPSPSAAEPAEPAFEAPSLGLDDDEPDFDSVSTSSTTTTPSNNGPDMPEPAWPGDGTNVMFEPDLGLGGLDDPLAAPSPSATPGSSPAPTFGDQLATLVDDSSNGHHAGSDSGSWQAAPDESLDLEVDLTGALDAIGLSSVNDALGKVVSRPTRPDGAQNAATGGPASSNAAPSGSAPSGAGPSGTGPSSGSPAPGSAAPNGGLGAGMKLAPTAGDSVAPADTPAEFVLGTVRVETGTLDASEPELDAVFEELREQAATDLAQLPQRDQSTRLLQMADTYLAAGMIDQARGALEQAAGDPRHRFKAMAALGRLYRRQDDPTEALRWLEQAAEAPAPSADDGRALLYDLADTLERTGEHTRALATWLDLLAEQEDYRDVRARVDRLVRADE
jgi:tetratricopeptide (TPR) repeat protein